jgi:hypothetical protein
MDCPAELFFNTALWKTIAPNDSVSIDMGRVPIAPASPRKSIRSDSSETQYLSCTRWVLSNIAAALKSIVPRRLDEPTGPFELVRRN